MDKIAAPVLVVLAIGAYFLINQQFNQVKQNIGQQVQVNPIDVPGPQFPAFKPIQPIQFQPFNPFAQAGPPPEPAADDYTPVRFESSNRMYRASFPGRKPTQASFPILEVKVTRYTVPKPGTMFEIDEYDSGWNAAKRSGTARAWLKKCHQDQLTGMHAREEFVKELTVGENHPGFAFEALYVKENKPQAWFGRIYLIDSQLVTASVYGDPAAVNLKAPAFLDSFAFTSRITGISDPEIKPVPKTDPTID